MSLEAWKPWIELLEIPGLGPRYWHRLLSQLATPDIVLNTSLHQLKAFVPERVAQAIVTRPSCKEVLDRTQEWLNSEKNRAILTWSDDRYPPALLQLPDPPPVIFYQGNIGLLEQPALAIVGGRNATPQGCRDAEAWAEALSDAGLTIVSGLALGIDAAAHSGALKGKGSTIAVIATGIDRVYPSQHRELAHKIAETGGLFSEFPLGTPAKSPHFPRRNRIISGLSQGCLVVEATIKSGSLITARLATEQGRDVFAIPGSIHSPLSKGCHQLIKEGAKLVESAEDILEEFKALRKNTATPHRKGLSSSSLPSMLKDIPIPLDNFGNQPPLPPSTLSNDPLWLALGFEVIDIDTLCIRTGLPIEQLSARLLELELEGYIVSLPGGGYQRIG